MQNSDRSLVVSVSLVAIHFVAASVFSILVGSIPEGVVAKLYYNTGLEPFAPCIAMTAGLLGLLVARLLRERTAIWSWIPGLLWFAYGAVELASSWSPTWSRSTRFDYVVGNLLGPTAKCSGSECLYEVFFTVPLVCSISYSLSSYLYLRAFRTTSSL